MSLPLFVLSNEYKLYVNIYVRVYVDVYIIFTKHKANRFRFGSLLSFNTKEIFYSLFQDELKLTRQAQMR